MQLFRSMDTNGDGVVSRTEFEAAYGRQGGVVVQPPVSPYSSASSYNMAAPLPYPPTSQYGSGGRASSPPRSRNSLTKRAGGGGLQPATAAAPHGMPTNPLHQR